jgi:hypothetical protein
MDGAVLKGTPQVQEGINKERKKERVLRKRKMPENLKSKRRETGKI